MYSRRRQSLIGGMNALGGVPRRQILQETTEGLQANRRQFLQAAVVTGTVGVVMGPGSARSSQ